MKVSRCTCLTLYTWHSRSSLTHPAPFNMLVILCSVILYHCDFCLPALLPLYSMYCELSRSGQITCDEVEYAVNADKLGLAISVS